MTEIRDQLQQSLGSHYTIKRELGGGGMSRVFVAHDEELDRDVVVKVLSPELAATLSVERFTREIRLAAGLQQANIVPVLSAGAMENGLPYYVMPWVEGQSLRDRLNGDTAISLRSATKILGDIACALEYAHARGIVHRDIKPENILLSGGTAVVTDFGIAKAISASKTQAPGGTLTVVGTSLGTPAYMAPEQAVGDKVDQRADIYAWGVVGYEMLAGKHPFGDKTTAQQLIAAHISETPAPLSVLRKDIPRQLAGLLTSALEKDPGKRPQTAQDIQRFLDDPALLGDTPTMSIPLAISAQPDGQAKRKWMIPTITGAAVVVGLAIFALASSSRPPSSASENADGAAIAADSAVRTVAVLPFVNTGGDPKDEYFSDGMTDELARALSKLPALKVASRTSSYAFKGKAVPVQEIGKALHVAGVVEGTVRRAGDRLRVTAQLTNANTGLVIWSDGFERGSTNVFEVQDDLTAAIVSALAPKLRGETKQNLAAESRGTEDREAYDLYLRGRFNWNKRSGESLMDGVADFKAAVERDPKFARAYAALASSYAILPQYAGHTKFSIRRSFELTKDATTRALAIDSSLAEPHAALGNVLMTNYKWAESKREYLRAIRLDSTYATAYHWYALWQANVGRWHESYALLKRARELDPLSHVIALNVCARAAVVGDFAGGEAACRESKPFMPRGAAYSDLLRGSYDSAAAEFRRSGEQYSSQGTYAYALALGGKRAEATALLRKFERDAERQPLNVALANLGLGNNDEAMRWLERALDAHEDALTTNLSPLATQLWDPLRKDPRFARLLEKMGLTEYARALSQ